MDKRVRSPAVSIHRFFCSDLIAASHIQHVVTIHSVLVSLISAPSHCLGTSLDLFVSDADKGIAVGRTLTPTAQPAGRITVMSNRPPRQVEYRRAFEMGRCWHLRLHLRRCMSSIVRVRPRISSDDAMPDKSRSKRR